MKAPVGLLSGRAVCVSRWRGFAPTSSAERSKRIFTGGDVEENGICSAAFCESAALRETNSLRLMACALSVKAYGFASSPKGRAKSTAGSFLIALKTLATNATAWLSLRESWRGSA